MPVRVAVVDMPDDAMVLLDGGHDRTVYLGQHLNLAQRLVVSAYLADDEREPGVQLVRWRRGYVDQVADLIAPTSRIGHMMKELRDTSVAEVEVVLGALLGCSVAVA